MVLLQPVDRYEVGRLPWLQTPIHVILFLQEFVLLVLVEELCQTLRILNIWLNQHILVLGAHARHVEDRSIRRPSEVLIDAHVNFGRRLSRLSTLVGRSGLLHFLIIDRV